MWSYLHYTSLPAPEAGYSQTSCLDSDRLEPSSATATAGECYSTDKLTAAYLDSLFGMTSAPLGQTTRQPEIISTDCDKSVTDSVSAEDSPVKILARQGIKPELPAHAPGYGKSMPVLLARLDPLTCLWKTPPTLLEEGLTLSVQTYPHWGIVLHGGLYPLKIPALPISAQDSGDWRYPTATTSGLRGGSGASAWVKSTAYYPTPCSSSYHGGTHSYWQIKKHPALSTEEKIEMVKGKNGKLNPDWVEWLMGWQIGWTKLQPGNFGTCKSTDCPGSQSNATTGGNG